MVARAATKQKKGGRGSTAFKQSMAIEVPLAGGKVVQLEGVTGIERMKSTMSKRDKKETMHNLEAMQAEIARMMAALA
jgi:hypothetical protein